MLIENRTPISIDLADNIRTQFIYELYMSDIILLEPILPSVNLWVGLM